jgi:hypothetical protein
MIFAVDFYCTVSWKERNDCYQVYFYHNCDKTEEHVPLCFHMIQISTRDGDNPSAIVWFLVYQSLRTRDHSQEDHFEFLSRVCICTDSYKYILVSLYWGVFNVLKITTTTHNDIVCISFNSKSAHRDPPIFIHMQKESSLSFPTVLGSGGCRLSLLNEICVGTKWLRSWFLWSYNVIWKLRLMWFEINVCNNSYVFFYNSKNNSMLWQAVISWSFYCDETWFTEFYCNLP